RLARLSFGGLVIWFATAGCLKESPAGAGLSLPHCVWGSSKPHVSQFAEKRFVPIKDRFGRILRAGPPFLRAPSLSPRGCGGHMPRLLSPSLNMPEASRGTGHGVALDQDETKGPRRR